MFCLIGLLQTLYSSFMCNSKRLCSKEKRKQKLQPKIDGSRKTNSYFPRQNTPRQMNTLYPDNIHDCDTIEAKYSITCSRKRFMFIHVYNESH